MGCLVQLLLSSAPDLQLSYPSKLQKQQQQQQQQQQQAGGGGSSSSMGSQVLAQREAAATAERLLAHVPPQPQLQQVAGGSMLLNMLSGLLGRRALEWGTGWIDGLSGPWEDYRRSGDPDGLLPPCDLTRLVGVKVPRGPCWVYVGQLQVPHAR